MISGHGLVFGLAGFSGSGKTVLAERLIEIFTSRGCFVSSIKHAHHDFDIDVEGKDSFRHRRAGSREFIISSSRRSVKFTESPSIEPSLADLLGSLSPSDVVIVEGFKATDFPKIEVHRPSLGHPFLHPTCPGVIAIASDVPLADSPLPVFSLNDAALVADGISGLLAS